MMGGDCSDKENAQVTDRENNNEAPREIRIAKSELNDSFEPEEPEQRRTSTKVKQRTFKRNFSPVHSNLFSPWRKAKDAPVIKAPNSHIRFDDVGEPILDLRPLGAFQSTESLGGFTTVKSKSQSKRKKNQFGRILELPAKPSDCRLGLGFVCSSPSPPPYEQPVESDSNYSPSISKYWAQRYRLFSKYDEGIRMDEEAWYSVTPEKIARDIAEKMSCGLIVDAFCGVGGNAIQFAMTCDRVLAIDIDSRKIEMAKHNAGVYGVREKIEFIVGDFFDIAPRLVADAMFLSPPWGGPEYRSEKIYNLQNMGSSSSMDGYRVFDIAKSVTPNIAFFVPKNTDLHQLKELSAGVGGKVFVEKNVMNHKTKVMTAYYGQFAKRLFYHKSSRL